MKINSTITTVQTILFGLSLFFCHSQEKIPNDEVVKQIETNGLAVREAFKKGDIETIKLYHHPDVVKALGYNNLRIGREAVLDGLRETMANFDLEFIGERDEELFLQKGDLVIKQMLFGLRLIPKNGDKPFIFRGRTLVILQQYDESPSGWATIHEIIQPYEEPIN
ncbi:hypothetical protein ACFSQJ_01860 [Croceitalea marina]|uniref:SnoaL-like domain-containing protein n=1 Tax=Croceitalea marina TaxID=1775166 RepID=A0ABW5MR06_9FLAO